MMSDSQALDLNQDPEPEDPMCPKVVIPPMLLRKLHKPWRECLAGQKHWV